MPSSSFTLEDPLTPSLTSLEQGVIDLLLAGEHPVLSALREQLKMATISSREFSGVGFFTHFKVTSTTSPFPGNFKNLEIGDVGAIIPNVKYGAGFILFVRDGFISCLEGYTYDDPWPKDTGQFKLSYGDDPNRKWLTEYLEKKQIGKG